jgi:hypothetical protein
VSAAPSRHPRTLTRRIVGAAVLLGRLNAVVFALLIGAVRSADGAGRRTNEILGASQAVSDLEQDVIDAETGMRGT